MIKGINKFFNTLNREQEKIIEDELPLIREIVNSKVKEREGEIEKEWDRLEKEHEIEQNTCSNCGGTEIVDVPRQKVNTSTS